jgi:hypothetical protein
MAIASASTARLALVKEAAWGATPATPAFAVARMTGESLNLTRQSVASNEIRADRNLADLIQVGGGAGGEVQVEWSYGGAGSALDLMLESALFGAWSSDVLKNGSDETSLTIEKTFDTGATGVFVRLTGMVANTMTLTATAGQVLTGGFGFLGKGGSVGDAALVGATYAPAPSGPVMDAAAGFASLGLGALSSPKIRSVSLSATNNLRGQSVVGSIEAAGLGLGRFDLTGSIEVYLENKQLLDVYLAGNGLDLSFVIGSVSGERYAFDLPRIKLTAAEVVAGGNDEDVMVRCGFQALHDPVEGCAIKVTRAVA